MFETLCSFVTDSLITLHVNTSTLQVMTAFDLSEKEIPKFKDKTL